MLICCSIVVALLKDVIDWKINYYGEASNIVYLKNGTFLVIAITSADSFQADACYMNLQQEDV